MLWSLLSILNFVQTKLPPGPFLLLSWEFSCVLTRVQSSLCLHGTNLQVGYCWVHGGCHQGAQMPLPIPCSPSFLQACFDTSITGMVTGPFVGSREGITVSLSPAPSPPQAALSRPPAQPVAQQYNPALIKQRGTAGCVLLGHHSVPWTHCREKAEASQCYPSKNRFNCPVMHTLGSCNVLLIWSI